MPVDLAASAGLFIGISLFEDDRIPEVPFAVDDAVDLAHLFSLELGLVAADRVVLLLSGEPKKVESRSRLRALLSGGALRHGARMPEIYRHLGEQTRSTEPAGLFLVTFAGHGFSDQSGDFLLASDSLTERALKTGVSVSEVFDEISRSQAERRLVLLDACRERSSRGTRGGMDARMSRSFADAIARARGLAVLSGATVGGYAYDDMTRGNGVFTAATLDGLRGEAAAGPDGWITVRTLADFVQERVAKWVRRHRPDHLRESLGIARRIEATAEALPLALHPAERCRGRSYEPRRELALARLRTNLGRILTQVHWDAVGRRLPARGPAPGSEEILEEIEALDGSERAQRSLRDFLGEQSALAVPLKARKPERDKVLRLNRPALPNLRRALRLVGLSVGVVLVLGGAYGLLELLPRDRPGPGKGTPLSVELPPGPAPTSLEALELRNLEIQQAAGAIVVSKVARAVPPRLWLGRLTSSSKGVLVEGFADDTGALATFIENLRKEVDLSEPVLVGIDKKVAGRGYGYRVRFEYRPLEKLKEGFSEAEKRRHLGRLSQNGQVDEIRAHLRSLAAAGLRIEALNLGTSPVPGHLFNIASFSAEVDAPSTQHLVDFLQRIRTSSWFLGVEELEIHRTGRDVRCSIELSCPVWSTSVVPWPSSPGPIDGRLLGPLASFGVDPFRWPDPR